MGEQTDLAAANPEILERLKSYMEEAYKEPRSQKDDGKYTGNPAIKKKSKNPKK